MDKEIDIQTIEKGVNLLKEASLILNNLNNDIFRLRDYLSKDYLLLKDLSAEDNVEVCAVSLQNTSNTLDDYIEDILVILKQISNSEGE